jgi:hypothetical protein
MSAVIHSTVSAKMDTQKVTTDHELHLARKDSALCLSTEPLGPYELEATPISRKLLPHLPDECVKQEESIALTTVLDTIKTQALKARHEQDNLLGLLHHLQDFHISKSIHESASGPPSYVMARLSHADYLRMLAAEGLDYITPYAEMLDANANYAVAPTADPDKKRGKVGRPRGKILRPGGGDDLYRRL